jgi:hypothetical protein
MVIEIKAAFFWVATGHSDVVGYHCFGGSCSLHLQDEDGLLLKIL